MALPIVRAMFRQSVCATMIQEKGDAAKCDFSCALVVWARRRAVPPFRSPGFRPSRPAQRSKKFARQRTAGTGLFEQARRWAESRWCAAKGAGLLDGFLSAFERLPPVPRYAHRSRQPGWSMRAPRILVRAIVSCVLRRCRREDTPEATSYAPQSVGPPGDGGRRLSVGGPPVPAGPSIKQVYVSLSCRPDSAP